MNEEQQRRHPHHVTCARGVAVDKGERSLRRLLLLLLLLASFSHVPALGRILLVQHGGCVCLCLCVLLLHALVRVAAVALPLPLGCCTCVTCDV